MNVLDDLLLWDVAAGISRGYLLVDLLLHLIWIMPHKSSTWVCLPLTHSRVVFLRIHESPNRLRWATHGLRRWLLLLLWRLQMLILSWLWLTGNRWLNLWLGAVLLRIVTIVLL